VPDITQEILEGRQPTGLKLTTLLQGMPRAWQYQRREFPGLVLTSK
jgi:hypothetical protein